ncbi:hypothetical protein Neosp_009014 [[Neocosmospora] mangrovei]
MPRSSGSSSKRRLRSATPSLPQKKSIAFLDRILQENAELRARLPPSESPPVKSTPAPSHHGPMPNDDEDAAQNQILEESDWFAHTRSSDTPIWIGEIADAAFATRFRQFASSSKAPSHIPRTQFASDDAIRGLAATNPPWPSPPCARLLIETALQFLRHNYHIVRRSEVLALSTSGFDHSGQGTNPASTAKIWALFAIGELRSSKCLNMDNNFPGLTYFAVASDAIRMINERPQLEVIETLLLLVSPKPFPASLQTDSYFWLYTPLKRIAGTQPAHLWDLPCDSRPSWASISTSGMPMFQIPS